MIQIEDKVVSFEILEEYFACDYKVCRGVCCIHGDAGPPVTEPECRRLGALLPQLRPLLSPEANEILGQRLSYIDPSGDRVLSIVGGANCVFTVYPEPNEGVRCAIEMYAEDGGAEVENSAIVKPMSCRLYPIRVHQFKHFTSLVYDRWEICAPAIARGKSLGIKVYQFVQQPLIDAFGHDFYAQLEEADRLLQVERKRCKR